MTDTCEDANSWRAALAALAVDPFGLGGIILRGRGTHHLEQAVRQLRPQMPSEVPFRRLPAQVSDARLLGGLDLAATLQAGKPVFERGLLADADGGFLIIPMAERLSAATTAHVCATIDAGEVLVARDGFSRRIAARFAVIVHDESVSDGECMPAALLERSAFIVNVEPTSGVAFVQSDDAEQITAARSLLPRVAASDELLHAFCRAAGALGIDSVRMPLFALRAARIFAALEGRARVYDQDAVMACRLVLAPRATRLPVPQEKRPDRPDLDGAEDNPDQESKQTSGQLEDVLLKAARAVLPADLLARIAPDASRRNAQTRGAGALTPSSQWGRPIGTRRGDRRSGARVNLVETLRAAAPWQKLRRAAPGSSGRVQVRRDDLRITRFLEGKGAATVFVVDASGSSALHRLAEAKGAVELLLADCYRRRDLVALISFRGRTAELVLPPTRSLTRAKRCLAELPGGGGTPVALAIDAANALASGLKRKGSSPIVVLLTDGRANVARDGQGGRERAEADALAAARCAKALDLKALLVDTCPVPGPAGERLALSMGARYVPLPRADAAGISQAVRTAAAEVHSS